MPKHKNLDDALDDWQVHSPGMWENETGPEGWYAVSNDKESIVAYFVKESDACLFRLNMVNIDLNT